MVRLRNTIALFCALATAVVSFAADFSYQQTTQITGGSMLQMMKMAGTFSSQARKAGEPITTTVYLAGQPQGDGLAGFDRDHRSR